MKPHDFAIRLVIHWAELRKLRWTIAVIEAKRLIEQSKA